MPVLLPASALALDPLDMRWTFGAHEPHAMCRRVGKNCTGGIEGNARRLRPWLDGRDADDDGHRATAFSETGSVKAVIGERRA